MLRRDNEFMICIELTQNHNFVITPLATIWIANGMNMVTSTAACTLVPTVSKIYASSSDFTSLGMLV